MDARPSLRIGSRGSPLALVQARLFADLLAAAEPALAAAGGCEIAAIVTSGDQAQDRSLAEIGGKGLFTKEIDAALLQGRIDLAVHSLKDLPTDLPAGIVLACVPERADPRDGLAARGAHSLADLAPGAKVGTASLRRAALVRARRPDVNCLPLRGNVETRLRKLDAGQVDAVLLAMAGLDRLGLGGRAVALAPDEMLPAVGQGALAVTCRADDAAMRARLAALDHAESRDAIAAERAFLAELDGSCRTPIAALAEISGGRLTLRGLVASVDGNRVIEARREGDRQDAEKIGRGAAAEILARGGPALLPGKG